jgi:hypothetical protein
MTFCLRFLAVVAIVAVTTPAPRAQKAPAGPPKKNPLLKLAEPWPEADVLEKRRVEAEARPLFKSADTLEFTLTAPFNIINKDHNPESTKRYPGVLTVAGADGTLKSIAVELSARGHFRRMARNCSTVPLRIEFTKGEAAGTVFAGQTTLKLGTGCESSKEFEQITLREYLTYPIYHMLTPLSFRARLARGTYVEEGSLKKTTALRDFHRAGERRGSPQWWKDREPSAHLVHRPRTRNADANDAVRVHDWQHRHVDLGPAQRALRAEPRAHALCRAVRLRPLGHRARAVRGPRSPARPPERGG